MRWKHKLSLLVVPLLLAMSLPGCECRCSSDADDKVEDVVDEIGDEMEDVAEKLKDDG